MPYKLNMENQKQKKTPLLLTRRVYLNIIKNQEDISYTLFIQIVSSERESTFASMVHFVRTTSSILLIGYVS